MEGKAKAWYVGDVIARNWTAKDHNDLIAAVLALMAAGPIAWVETLSASGWSSVNKTQTVRNEKYKVSNKYAYIFAPSPESPSSDNVTKYGKAGIFAGKITADGEITFHCEKVPTANIGVNVIRKEVST